MSVYVAIHTAAHPSVGEIAEFGRLALMLGAEPNQPLAVLADRDSSALTCVLPVERLRLEAEGGEVCRILDGVLERLSADWRLLKEHHPVGGYLPVGQLDGDCRCGQGPWPCDTVRNAVTP